MGAMTYRLQSDVLDALLWLDRDDDRVRFDVWTVPTLFAPRVHLGGAVVEFHADTLLTDAHCQVPETLGWGAASAQLSGETLMRHWRAIAARWKLDHLDRRLEAHLAVFEHDWIRSRLLQWMERLANEGRSRTRTWKALCDEVSRRLRHPESDRDAILITALFSHDVAARHMLEAIRLRCRTAQVQPDLGLRLHPIVWPRSPAAQEVA